MITSLDGNFEFANDKSEVLASLQKNFNRSYASKGRGQSRVAYVQQVSGTTIDTTAANNRDTGGHGTIDLAIVGGLNDRVDIPGGGTDFEDADGYNYGLGIAPFARLGSSRIFDPNFTFPDHTQLTGEAYIKGARISSNSWGAGWCRDIFGNLVCCPAGTWGSYDATSQEFDLLVRDARPASALDGGQAGNQEMVIVFAAGNFGQCLNEQLGNNGTTAKNTIVVGACESWNQQAAGVGCWNNGDADDIRDIAQFSSCGATQDNRIKPDIMAPGVRIFGAASQDPGYTGATVCDQFFPAGQTLYTWSTGTSHATPAVAGACALLRQWFLNLGRAVPSPAMTKAYLMNSTTYMTGTGANDNLPSNNQGMGRMNLQRAFNNVPRILIDQTHIFDNTGQVFTIKGSISDNTEPFRVTLAWTDAMCIDLNSPVVNNLDLEVSIDDGITNTLYLGNVFNNDQSQIGGNPDPNNNVESVWLPAGTTGKFEITVRASVIGGDGVPNLGDSTDQDFALVVYNALHVRLQQK